METRVSRIMLVEDNPEDIALTRRVLRKGGLGGDLVLASTGREALECLVNKAGSDLPGLILLDINLPDLSGIDILTEIKKNPSLKPIPVVMLTGSNTDDDIQRSYDLGASTYLVKPVSIDALKLVLENVFQSAAF
jgi:two-component system, response regulator